MQPDDSRHSEAPRHALPDFCAPGAVLLLVLLGVALALVLTLAGTRGLQGFWTELGTTMLFVQWVILSAAALLCLARGALERFSPRTSAWLAFALIQAVVLIYSLVIIALPGYFQALELLAFSEPGLFVLRNIGISLLASFVLVRYLSLRQRWQSQLAAESRARLDALQARIRPHFLFNALNTIASLIRTRPDQAEAATLDLSDLLRTGLHSGARHKLGEELELVRGYLRIETLRLGERLQVEWALAGDLPLDQAMPALLIQPLVENAIVHGIARLPEGGGLVIDGRRDGRRMKFVIENPVPDHAGGAREPADGNSMALDNIRQRLELAYDDRARLKTRRADGRFVVELTLPVE